MEVLYLTIFVSLVLVCGGAMFFAWIVRQKTFDQSERLALLPLGEERSAPAQELFADRCNDKEEEALGDD